MPISNVNHTVDIIFTSDEIKELLKEKANQVLSNQRMVFDTISVDWDDKECNHSDKLLVEKPEEQLATVDRNAIPAFTLHFKAEGS